MSLPLHCPVPAVPAQTALVARAAFPRGNVYLLLGDRLGPLFDDAAFCDLYPALGRPAYAPWRLALITLMQFVASLFIADARGRIEHRRKQYNND